MRAAPAHVTQVYGFLGACGFPLPARAVVRPPSVRGGTTSSRGRRGHFSHTIESPDPASSPASFFNMVIGFANSNRMTSEIEGGGHDESERAFSSDDHYGRLPVGHTLTSGTDQAVSERGHEKSSGALTRLIADAEPDPGDSEAFIAPVAARLASHPGCDVRPVSSEERSIWGSRYQYQKTTGPGSRSYSFFGTFCLVFEFENEELVARSEVDGLTCGSISDDAPTFPWGIQGLVYGRSSVYLDYDHDVKTMESAAGERPRARHEDADFSGGKPKYTSSNSRFRPQETAWGEYNYVRSRMSLDATKSSLSSPLATLADVFVGIDRSFDVVENFVAGVAASSVSAVFALAEAVASGLWWIASGVYQGGIVQTISAPGNKHEAQRQHSKSKTHSASQRAGAPPTCPSKDFGRTADCVRVRRRVTAALFWGFRIPPYLRQWGREVTLALHSLAHWAWEVLLAPALPQSVVVRLGPRQRAVHLAGGKSSGIGGGTGGGRSWFQQL